MSTKMSYPDCVYLIARRQKDRPLSLLHNKVFSIRRDLIDAAASPRSAASRGRSRYGSVGGLRSSQSEPVERLRRGDNRLEIQQRESRCKVYSSSLSICWRRASSNRAPRLKIFEWNQPTHFRFIVCLSTDSGWTGSSESATRAMSGRLNRRTSFQRGHSWRWPCWRFYIRGASEAVSSTCGGPPSSTDSSSNAPLTGCPISTTFGTRRPPSLCSADDFLYTSCVSVRASPFNEYQLLNVSSFITLSLARFIRSCIHLQRFGGRVSTEIAKLGWALRCRPVHGAHWHPIRHHGRQIPPLDLARHGPQYLRPFLLGALEFVLLPLNFRGFVHLLVPLLASPHHGKIAQWWQMAGRKVRNVLSCFIWTWYILIRFT